MVDRWCGTLDDGRAICSDSGKVVPKPGRRVKKIAPGGKHTCALLDDGSVACWGDNSLGQLGIGNTVPREVNLATTPLIPVNLDGNKVTEGALNRVEHAIRCYDPCLSCSTHAIGQMPMDVELQGPDGEVLDHVVKG